MRKRKKADDYSSGKKLKEFEVINRLAVTITDAEPFSNLLDILASEIKKIFGAIQVLITRFEKKKRIFRIISVKGDGAGVKKILNILKMPVDRMEIAANPRRFDMLINNKVTMFNNVEELTGGSISRKQSLAIQKQLGKSKIIRLTLNYRRELLGDIILFLHPDQSLPSSESMKVIANLACVTIRRQEAEEALSSAIMEKENLSANLVKIRELERAQIAKDIHDELGQNLTVLKMNNTLVSLLIENDRKDEARVKLDASDGIIERTIQSVRRISQELRPWILEEFGLAAAVEWQINEFSKLTGVSCSFWKNRKSVHTDKEQSIGLFRIVQEALTNISRHSMASKVEVSLKSGEKSLVLTITDDGVGIRQEILQNPWSPGLAGMKERVRLLKGKLEITSAPDKGTTIKATIPVV